VHGLAPATPREFRQRDAAERHLPWRFRNGWAGRTPGFAGSRRMSNGGSSLHTTSTARRWAPTPSPPCCGASCSIRHPDTGYACKRMTSGCRCTRLAV